jgi:hypothetical protein
MDTNTLINLLTPIFGPIMVAGMKLLAPKLPGWTLPIICTIVGAAGNIIAHYVATIPQDQTMVAILLALAGVGVREIKDQLTPETKPKGGDV